MKEDRAEILEHGEVVEVLRELFEIEIPEEQGTRLATIKEVLDYLDMYQD